MRFPLQTFDFQSHAVRTLDRDGVPWFVAADVCRVLEISNPRDAVSSLDDDEKGVGNTDTLGGEQALNIISESGLYALIFRSRKPQAKAFRKWVTSEVLPEIRRTGAYNMIDGVSRVQRILQQAIEDVYQDRMSLPKANAIAGLASQFLRTGAALSLPK